jgi:hypothetical protein
LEEHRKTCEREGNYIEAEMAKNRIDELRIQDTQRQLEQLQLKGQQERQEIDEAHQKEYE